MARQYRGPLRATHDPNAMKKLRTIEMPKPQDPYRKAQQGLLRHFAMSEAEFRALQRERPREGDAMH